MSELEWTRDSDGVGGWRAENGGSLPAPWTTEPGGGLRIDDTVADEVLLDLAPDAATSLGTIVAQWRNAAGTVVGHFDEDGGGGLSADNITWGEAGQFVQDVDGATIGSGDALYVLGVDGVRLFVVSKGGLQATSFRSLDGSDIALLVSAVGGQTASLFEAWDETGNGPNFKINKAGYPILINHAAPADDDLAAGECSLWFDETDGAAKLMVKAKSANGTVRTGSVTLT